MTLRIEQEEKEVTSSTSSQTTTATTSARVEISLDKDTSDSDSPTLITIIDPRNLHQTSDFDLWMTLRKQIVDVSASQLSVVLGTNFFTSRDQLLQEKIETNKIKQQVI